MTESSPTTDFTEHYSSTTREPILGALWRFRELILSLIARNLTVKYQRSTLGVLWTLISPIMMVLVLVMVFNSILRVAVDGFWAFLISGFFAWGFASASMNRATTILRGNAGLRRSVAFPSEIVVLSTVSAQFVEFLVEITIVVVAIFVFYHHAVPTTVILLPYLILLQVLITLGLMFPLAVLSVLYSDVEHAMPALLRLWFFLTPIFYPVTMIPEALRPYFYLNPFFGLLQLFHMVLYEGVWPSWVLLGGMSAASIGIFCIGYWIFTRLKDVCVEIA